MYDIFANAGRCGGETKMIVQSNYLASFSKNVLVSSSVNGRISPRTIKMRRLIKFLFGREKLSIVI